MSDLAAPVDLRLTVRGAAGCVDLVVPPGADVESLGREYAAAFGTEQPPVLVTTTGRALEARVPLRRQGVTPGDVLVALEPDVVSPDVEGPRDRTQHGSWPDRVTPADQGGPGVRSVLTAVSVAFAGLAALAGAVVPGPSRTAAAVVLAVAALLSSLAVPALRGASRTAHAMAAPAFAGTAGLLLSWSTAPGGVLLATAVGALAAGVAAAVARAGADERTERLLRVWLVAAGTTAVSSAVSLAAGAGESALWAWLFVAAVVAARLLPYLVVDVPDEVLLDMDRLAVTAWSPRERPRGSRRRLAVRPRGVAELARQGRDLLVAGAVALAVVATIAAILLACRPGSGIESVGVRLVLLFGGSALALTARSYRAVVPRFALRVPALLALSAVLVFFLGASSADRLWWALAALAVTVLALVAAAISLGRGWRSIWWARTADVVEGGSVVLCVAAFPVAAGIFSLVRQLPS